MKTVFSNARQVAHLWANQTQATAKSDNIFFEHGTIYSYGHHFPIARFVDASTVLFTTRGYSNTTAKHKSFVRNAIPNGIEVIHVRNVEARSKQEHKENFKVMKEDVASLLSKATKAHGRKASLLSDASETIQRANQYSKRFKLGLKMDESKIPEWQKEIAIQQAKAQKQAKAKQVKFEQMAQESIGKWLAGENVSIPGGVSRTFLRVISGHRLQTSRGAEVPLNIAKRLYQMFLETIKSGIAWTRPPETEFKIGGFPLREISADGTVSVGCHTIDRAEIERFATTQNW